MAEIAPKKRGRPAGSKTRFSGIGIAADALDVTPNHLWKVVTGQRQSESLMARVRSSFPALLASQLKSKQPAPKL